MRFVLFLLSLMLLVAAENNAQAFQFAPFRTKLDPSGPGATQLFTVDNDSNSPVSVRIHIATREISVNGVEKKRG